MRSMRTVADGRRALPKSQIRIPQFRNPHSAFRIPKFQIQFRDLQFFSAFRIPHFENLCKNL